jgi:hypothetical protein
LDWWQLLFGWPDAVFGNLGDQSELAMRYRLRTLLILLAVGFLLASWWLLVKTTPLGLAVKEAKQIALFEGLPHPLYEEQQFEQEQRTKAVRKIGNYLFYQGSLILNEGDGKRLTDILGDASTLEPFKGEKKCGGFHPDYAVEFRHGNTRYSFLICFGCGEVKITGPNTNLRMDMTRDGKKRLSKVLKGYRANRPIRAAPEE